MAAHAGVRVVVALAVLGVGLHAGNGSAEARTWPKPEGYLSDFANVIEPAYRDSIEALAAELRDKTRAEMAVVTVPDLAGETIEPVAVDLFKAWGIGAKGSDEGVLILLALKERRVKIEVGYGLEGILPDGLCGFIIRRVMAPDLVAGRYGAGMWHGASAVAGIVAKDRGVALTGAIDPRSTEEEPGPPSSFFVTALILAILLSSILRRMSRRRGWGWGGRGPWTGGPGSFGGGGMFGGFGGMGGGFGGGGGGGFGGFGGGRSGGGGASGGF